MQPRPESGRLQGPLHSEPKAPLRTFSLQRDCEECIHWGRLASKHEQWVRRTTAEAYAVPLKWTPNEMLTADSMEVLKEVEVMHAPWTVYGFGGNMQRVIGTARKRQAFSRLMCLPHCWHRFAFKPSYYISRSNGHTHKAPRDVLWQAC